MSSVISVLGVFADVVILLALAAAVASPTMSQLARPVITTFAFACAWLITGVFDAVRAPGWTIFLGGAVIVVSIASLHIWTQEGNGGHSGPGHRGDHGGGGPRHRPDTPQHRGGSDPSWWPEFDRQLALYVAEQEREQRQPAVLPAEPTTEYNAVGGQTRAMIQTCCRYRLTNILPEGCEGLGPGGRSDGERRARQAPAPSPEEKWELF